jgi:hypothetical protein
MMHIKVKNYLLGPSTVSEFGILAVDGTENGSSITGYK